MAGTKRLVALALRRDRVRLPTYVLGLTGLAVAMLTMWSAEAHQAIVDEVELFARTPALRMFGVPSGATVGAAFMIRGYLLLAALAAVISLLAVVRHTREEEETGRAELVGAAVVGRYAELAAALIVTVGANVVLTLLLTVGGLAVGLDATGALLVGLAVGGFGILFAAVAAVTVQLASTARGASGLAAAVLGVSFALSGVGNMLGTVDPGGRRVTSAWPAWLSPMGWGQQMRPFGGDEWAPFGLFAAGFVGLIVIAGMLTTRRDVGSGVLAARPGHAVASPWILSPARVIWRLQRGALLGWAIGMAGFGLVFGAITNEMKDTSHATTEWYARMSGASRIIDAYQTSVVEMAGMAIAVYVVQILLRMRAEEADGKLESVLATSVGRPRWAASYLLNATLGSLVLLLVFTLGMGVTSGIVVGDIAGQLQTLVGAGLVQVTGIMVFAGIVVAATALVPRWTIMVSWAAVMLSILLGPLFGAATFQLPESVQNASPFTHVPKVPAAETTVMPILSLLLVAAGLVAVGVIAFRRRDLALPA